MGWSGLSTKATESSSETDELGRPSAANRHACREKTATVGAHRVGIGVGFFPEPCNFERCAVHAVTVKLDIAITSNWGDECRVRGVLHAAVQRSALHDDLNSPVVFRTSPRHIKIPNQDVRSHSGPRFAANAGEHALQGWRSPFETS